MTNQPENRLDPVLDADRGTGTAPPESGSESANVVGRPPAERPRTAFHEPEETPDLEREPFNEREALEEGGSFDGIAPPGAVSEE
jgi:hypothetical protein